MPTGHRTAINSIGQLYMPINLKWIVQRAGIKQARVWQAVRQLNGEPLSPTAGDKILNWNDWPRKTPQHSIKTQIEALLREANVSETDIAIAWELDDDDKGRNGHPAGVHELQHKRAAFETNFEMEPEMLSELARKHFQLFRDPFHDDVSQESDVFLSADIRHVRQAMFLTAKLGGILAVIGESGSGKTILRRDLFDRVEREHLAVRIIMPRAIDKEALTAGHICEAIILEMEPGAKIPRTIEGKARKAEKLLAESMAAGNVHVVTIEEAQDLSNKMLKLLKRFWELEQGFKKLLSIILVGQNELLRKLDAKRNPDIREFINRCEQVQLPPLDAHLEKYLEFKFKRIERPLDALFDKDAFDGMRARLKAVKDGIVVSQCYPLLINNLVTKAMNASAQIGCAKVSAAVIKDL